MDGMEPVHIDAAFSSLSNHRFGSADSARSMDCSDVIKLPCCCAKLSEANGFQSDVSFTLDEEKTSVLQASVFLCWTDGIKM